MQKVTLHDTFPLRACQRVYLSWFIRYPLLKEWMFLLKNFTQTLELPPIRGFPSTKTVNPNNQSYRERSHQKNHR